MQYRPTPAELLVALAELLDDVLLPALPTALQHQARVGANIARILEREQRLPAGSVGGRELAERLRHSDDSEFDRAAWADLVESVRADLAIAKPGYADWTGT